MPKRSASTDAGTELVWIAARTFGVVVAIVLEPVANNSVLLGPMADYGALVKMDQHVRTPLRMSRRTDPAMKKADRRGEM